MSYADRRCIIFPFSEKAWIGTWEVLVGAWDNAQARQGKGLRVEEGISFYSGTTHAWSCWETMRVGDEIVCLCWIELHPVHDDLEMPRYYSGTFKFWSNNVNLFGPANGELLERLSVIPESKGESQKEGFCIWQPGASGAVLSRVSDGRGYLY